jgi:hypothetical protein
MKNQVENKEMWFEQVKRKIKHASSITDLRKIELMLFHLKTQPRPASDSKWVKEYLELKQLEVMYLKKVFEFLQSINPPQEPQDKVGKVERVKVVML